MTEKLNTITVKKGISGGKNYLLFALNGQQIESEKLWTISRQLTGTTNESSLGVFSHSSYEKICFGDQSTDFPSSIHLNNLLDVAEYARILKARILYIRKWVGEQDYDVEESFRV